MIPFISKHKNKHIKNVGYRINNFYIFDKKITEENDNIFMKLAKIF